MSRDYVINLRLQSVSLGFHTNIITYQRMIILKLIFHKFQHIHFKVYTNYMCNIQI